MEIYNYKEAIQNDIREYITKNVDIKQYPNKESAFNDLFKKMYNSKITGGESQSYFWDSTEAEQALIGNWGLIAEAFRNLGLAQNPILKGAEWCDAVIRQYLLKGELRKVLKDIYN